MTNFLLNTLQVLKYYWPVIFFGLLGYVLLYFIDWFWVGMALMAIAGIYLAYGHKIIGYFWKIKNRNQFRP